MLAAMVVAKNPGVGRGRGGGRPRGKVREADLVQLRLSPRAAELLWAAAEAQDLFPWQVVENAPADAQGGPGDRSGGRRLPGGPGEPPRRREGPPGPGPQLPGAWGLKHHLLHEFLF